MLKAGLIHAVDADNKRDDVDVLCRAVEAYEAVRDPEFVHVLSRAKFRVHRKVSL